MTAHSATTRPTRIIDGAEVPVAGTWTIDPDHAEVAFIGRHLMFSKVRGRFTDVSGTVILADDPRDSSVEVTIGMASVSSGSQERDDHLRSAEWFNVETFPEATFRSTSVDWSGDRADVTGDLTIRGVTRPVVLDVEFSGATVDPWGGRRAIFSASTEIDREDWGISWNVPLETGGVLVGKRIRIEIEVETVLSGSDG